MTLDPRENRSRSGTRTSFHPRAAPKEELWRSTPCAIPYVSVGNTFDHTDRFKLFSIYHRDDVNKPKPVFNDIEKPELLLQQFRRDIAEAGSDRFKKRNILDRKSAEKERLLSLEPRSKSKKSLSPDKLVTDRLYKLSPKKQDGRYDRFGIRCNLESEEPLKLQLSSQQQNIQKSLSEHRQSEMGTTQ